MCVGVKCFGVGEEYFVCFGVGVGVECSDVGGKGCGTKEKED